MSKDVNVTIMGWFLPALTLLFIGLKLGDVIDWSWWWVLAPMWIPISVCLTILCVGAVFIIVREALR